MLTLERLRRGELVGVRRLDLAADLDSLPPEVFGLADTLEVLNLSGNRLQHLPPELPRLKKLKVLFASGNPFTRLPEVLGECGQLEMVGFKGCRIQEVPAGALPPRLRWLILTDNRIEDLPAALGERGRLQKLMLAGNRLSRLPDLAGCTRLELLRLAANRFEALPPGLTELPRLAWLALGGNPLWAGLERQRGGPRLPVIDPAGLRMGEELGRGASGVIHAAEWRVEPGAVPRPVAVKRFHAAITSDGLPDCERAASLAAAGHPGLIDVLGELPATTQGDAGSLVMERLGAGWRALADPPSLASCTRDVYADNLRLPTPALMHVARRSAAVMAHLHARGLLHGDLYAHNLLWNGNAQAPDCRLSDFGAASFFDAMHPQADALQRLELRAWGCLAEELIDHAATPGDPALARLAQLRDACLQPQVRQRPAFSDVAAALGG